MRVQLCAYVVGCMCVQLYACAVVCMCAVVCALSKLWQEEGVSRVLFTEDIRALELFSPVVADRLSRGSLANPNGILHHPAYVVVCVHSELW